MTINKIRRERLAEIIEEHGSCDHLAELTGYHDFFFRKVLEGRKPMGKVVARRIEQSLGLPEQYLDQSRTLTAEQYLEQLNQTRHRRLAKLISQHKNVASYCRQFVSGHRDVGEKAARRIEEAAGLPFGWLDMREPPKKAP